MLQALYKGRSPGNSASSFLERTVDKKINCRRHSRSTWCQLTSGGCGWAHVNACIRVLAFEMTRGKISTIILSERCPTACTKSLNYHTNPELLLVSWKMIQPRKRRKHKVQVLKLLFALFPFFLKLVYNKKWGTVFQKYVNKYFWSKPLFPPVPAVPLRLFLRFILSAPKI